MRSVAVLGATGSIGRQALEIVGAHPELQVVCARGRHSDDAGLVAAAMRHGVGRIALVDPAAAAARAAPVRRRGARGGRGRRAARGGVRRRHRPERDRRRRRSRATLAALAAGVDLALANKESLVAGGPLVAAAARPQRRGACCRSTPSTRRSHQCLDGAAESARSIESLVVTASGGPFRGRSARRARRRDGRPTRSPIRPGHGREDHDRLGDAHEQGPRGDRGAPAVRRAATTASRSSCSRSRSCTARPAAATARCIAHLGRPTCACRSPTRSPIRSARATPVPRSTSAAAAPDFEPPDVGRVRCLALARAGGPRAAAPPRAS